MGSFRDFGEKILKRCGSFKLQARNAAVTGTGWPDQEKLLELGFTVEYILGFTQLGIKINEATSHDCKFLVGHWHNQPFVVSCGRVHLYQNEGRFRINSPLRRWLAVLMALMGNGEKIVTTSAVGGQGPDIKDGMIVMPTGIHAVDLSTPHLMGEEFTSPEELLRDPEKEKAEVFVNTALLSGLCPATGTGHRLIEGRRFGNRLSRQVYLLEGCQTVGMSMVPILDAVCIENQSRTNPIRVMPALYVTDANDYPNHEMVKERALQDAPKLAYFLNLIVQAEW